VPPGWVASNFTYHETPGWDLTDISSDAFLDWVIVTDATASDLESSSAQNDTAQIVNGQPIADWLSGNVLFSASDGRLGGGLPQVRQVITKPFDLSSVTNPVLSFYSSLRISGNRTEGMFLEYSIDGGTNWLPGAYYQRADTTLVLDLDGSFDAVTSFNTPGSIITRWVDPVIGPRGGKLADYLLAPLSPALSPYLVQRDDTALSRRVEVVRLPKAAKQKDVRLRFAHVGSCGWYWVLDNIAFYDIAGPITSTQITIASIALSGSDVVLNWQGGTGPYLVQGTSSLTNGSTWVDLLTTSANTATIPRALPMTFYRIQDGAAKTVTLFKSVLNGANERPPITPPPTGTGIGLLSLDGTTASYWLSYKDLTGPATLAHVHGPADTNTAAGVMFNIAPPGGFGTGTSGVISGSATITSEQASNITAGLTYFNVHTAVNGSGEIRGQLLPP
jgi:hypothetical protein